MSKKLNLDEIIEAATLVGISGEPKTLLIKKVEAMLKEMEENKEPKVKKPKGDLIVVLSSPGPIPDNTVASVFSVAAETDSTLLLDSIRAAAVSQNLKKAKKKDFLTKFFDVILLLKPKFAKEAPTPFKVMTKEACQTVVLTPEEQEEFIKIPKGNNQ